MSSNETGNAQEIAEGWFRSRSQVRVMTDTGEVVGPVVSARDGVVGVFINARQITLRVPVADAVVVKKHTIVMADQEMNLIQPIPHMQVLRDVLGDLLEDEGFDLSGEEREVLAEIHDRLDTRIGKRTAQARRDAAAVAGP